MLLRPLAGLLLLLVSTVSNAVIGTIDQVPGATLLIPHFEVDTTSGNRVTTILTVQNASATSILVNLTLWTDYGLPTARFNLYLTGFDQETLDLRDMIVSGFTPVTASVGQDPTDSISNHGPISQDINFASCGPFLPEPQASTGAYGLIEAHTGQASTEYFGGLCGAANIGDGIARGYVTMDTVNQCAKLTPADTGYFNHAVATVQNVLLGDYTIVDRARSRLLVESAVPIEADFVNPLTSTAGNPTFYGRFISNNATDFREPLPTAFAARSASSRTDVTYWRDPGQVVAPFACGGTPAPYPLGQRHLTVFNANGTVSGNPGGNQFPNAEGSTAGSALGLTPALGWLFSNLNLPDNTIRQSWMTFTQVPSFDSGSAPLGYSVPGVQLGNASSGANPIVP